MKTKTRSSIEVMGVINITPDSFWVNSRYENDKAVDECIAMSDQGAKWIDVGAESTRPGSMQLSHGEEWKRLEPFLMSLEGKINTKKTKISIDTYHSENIKKISNFEISMINNPSGMPNEKALKIICQKKLHLIVSHALWPPNKMQAKPLNKTQVMLKLISFFQEASEKLQDFNIDKYYLDPGIGFGKTQNANIEIINNLEMLKKINKNIAIGVSRKSLIGELSKKDIEERLEGSLFVALWSILNGARLIRVHDVKETLSFMKSWGIDC
ncbi:dihydropteroate synthase [bacterium]|nr:dihydropteroate synthase [bacterium]